MTSLETRLRDTEAALYATLRALQDQGDITLAPVHVDANVLETSKPQRSKAERQHEWKREPLQTREDLVAWLGAKQQQHANAHNIRPNAAPSRDLPMEVYPSLETPDFQEDELLADGQPSPTPSSAVMEQLKKCTPPKIPNFSFSGTNPVAWLDSYF